MTAIEMAYNLEKYRDLKNQFPQTVDDVVAMLRQLHNENTTLRKQLKNACNALMERQL